MVEILLRGTALLIGYILGCFQTAYLIGKIKGIDLREHGSGNLGTTNAFRVLGSKLGALTFLGDFLKAVIAYCLVYYLLDWGLVCGLYAGLGTILGHNYPVFLKFKGGKGIAATGGVMLCINPLISLTIIAGMFIIVFTTKYMSLGSIIAVIALIIWSFFEFNNNLEALIITIIIGLLALFQHRSNIVRLLKGTENKLGSSKKSDKKEEKGE